MGESNSFWGYLEDDEQRTAWDHYDPLPSKGENPHLDSLCERKHISIGDLVRVGARLSAPTVLAFAFPGGLKYRDLETDQRWAYVGSTFPELKVVPAVHPNGGPPTVLVAEGETDGAWLSAHYPGSDVALLPVGALGWKPRYTEQLQEYERVFLALDADAAGDQGAEAIAAEVLHAARFRPPAGDWCEVEGDPPPLPVEAIPVAPLPVLVPAGQLLQLDTPDVAAYHSVPILPLAGTAMLHGSYKSGKSFVALDLMAALAQGRDWAGFTAIEEPVKVAVLQFEIPWAFYRARIEMVRNHVADLALFDANFLTYTPLSRPKLVAGRPESEDPIIRNLLEAGTSVALIDPLRRGMGFADLNAENEVRRILHFAERLNDHGIAAVMVHHDNKSGSRHGGGDPDDMTGSGAFAGDVDSILSITRPAGVEKEEPKRNMKFLLRNGESPALKGFTWNNGHVVWHDEGFIQQDEGDEDF